MTIIRDRPLAVDVPRPDQNPAVSPQSAVTGSTTTGAPGDAVTKGGKPWRGQRASALTTPPSPAPVSVQDAELDGASSFADRLAGMGDGALTSDNLVAAFLKLGVLDSTNFWDQQGLSNILRTNLHEVDVNAAKQLQTLAGQVEALKAQIKQLTTTAKADTDKAAQQMRDAIAKANAADAGPADRPKSEAELKADIIEQIRAANPAAADSLSDQSSLSEVLICAGKNLPQDQRDALNAKLDEWFPGEAAGIRASLTAAGAAATQAEKLAGDVASLKDRMESIGNHLSDPQSQVDRKARTAQLEKGLLKDVAGAMDQSRPDHQAHDDTIAEIDSHRAEVAQLLFAAIDRKTASNAATKKNFRG